MEEEKRNGEGEEDEDGVERIFEKRENGKVKAMSK